MTDTLRKLLSSAFVGFCALSVLIALVPLAFILFFVVTQGIRAINFDFFTHLPRPVGEAGGGMANAIVGTLIVTGLASLMAVPIGIVSGIYMSEYAGTRFAAAARFAADTLNGVPSIVVGVFAYGVAVLPFKQFSAMAGGFALGVMMIPIIARTTEELLLLVPGSMREGALALGATRARAVFTVVLPAALPGIVTGLASLMAVPIGIVSGIYMSEYAGTRFAAVARFAADTLNGVPSIVIGVFAYGVAVLPFKQFSAMAGGFALGVMMIPIIARTTEELLLLVPGSMREGALALGATRARAVFTVVLPAALPGIVTGVVLALARIAGETAPLLFTSFNNRFFTTRLTQPISTLTVQVYTFATSPYPEWHAQAWAGALVLVTIVLLCSILARVATRRLERMQAQ